MKKMVSLFVALLIVLIIILQLNYVLRPTDTDGAYTQIETFHSLPENNIEVIIYGSSAAFRGFNTMKLYENYGIGAYNYAWHWQTINTTKAFIKDSFTTQSPKVVVIETFKLWMTTKDSELCGETYYPRYLHNEEAKKELLFQYLGDNPTIERKLSYFFPFYMFHSNWKNITIDSIKPLKVGDKLRKTMGFSDSYDISVTSIPDYKSFRQLNLPQDVQNELREIVKICREKNTRILFYTSPWGGEFAFSDAMKEFCTENDCKYINLFEKNDEVGIDGSTDFSDVWHLNAKGATKVADYLGKILKNDYQLTDMRTIPNNIWEQALMME